MTLGDCVSAESGWDVGTGTANCANSRHGIFLSVGLITI